jgi:hypothetical protein
MDANVKTPRWSRQLLSGLLFAIVVSPALLGIGLPDTRAPAELYLWAWQRNEDLSFIDPATTGIALWVGTITVDKGRIELAPRQNPVTYPDGSALLAVVRIEVDDAYDTAFAEQLAERIQGLVAPLTATELQIDFDARVSQRDLYRALIDALRANMPQWRLSITALASWCLGDPWLDELHIDAAVPMLYRMGSDGPRIRQYLSQQGHFPATICRNNIGYSSDEPIVPARGVQRIFWYHPVAWRDEDFATVQRAVAQSMQR